MRYKALVQRILKEMIRDKRTLLLMMVAPLFILMLMHVVFDHETATQLVVGYRQVPDSLIEQFPDTVTLTAFTTDTSAKKLIEQHQLDTFIETTGAKLTLTYDMKMPIQLKANN